MVFKYGIIGCGAIAEKHAEALAGMPGADLVGVLDRSHDRAVAFGEKWSVDSWSSLDAFLIDCPCEAVIICTPSGSHMDPAIAAAESGRHVICEKPIEVTTERVDKIIEACTEAGVTLAGVFQRRFLPGFILLQAAAKRGRFGKIALASASVKWWRDQEYYDSGAWRGTWALDGGGALMNQAIHTVDQLLALAGPVKAVSAATGLLAHENIEVEDTAVAMLEFESGAFGVLEASTACWSEKGRPQEVQISGSDGSVIMRDGKFTEWSFRESSPADTLAEELMDFGESGAGANDPMAISVVPFRQCHEEFMSAINEGRLPLMNAAECRRPIELIQAVYESARTGQRIEL
jgi:predicted dehydrogenase